MESQEVNNWFKLNLLLDRACAALRTIFHTAWKTKYGKEWDSSSSTIILQLVQPKNNQAFFQEKIAKGDISSWDITILRTILTAEDLFNLPQKQKIKIHKISDKRNYLAHHPTKVIPAAEFYNLWDAISNILVSFGESKSKLQQLKKSALDGSTESGSRNDYVSESSHLQFIRFRNVGNECFNRGLYATAIQIFSEAIALPGLAAPDLAVIHENRCAVYLKQCEIKNDDPDQQNNALEDALRATELWPGWWRGHFTLGKVYVLTNDFQKAVHCLNRALHQEPSNPEISITLKEVFFKAWHKTKEGNERKCVKESQKIDLKEQLKLLMEFVIKSPETYCNLHPGVAEAEFAIGMSYVEGIGVSADMKEGFKWLQRSMSHESSSAANVMGLLHEYGKVDRKSDMEKAKQFYKKAASHWLNPDTNAMINLALLYEQEQDYENALRLCLRTKGFKSKHPLMQELTQWLMRRKDEFLKSEVVDWEKKNGLSVDELTIKKREERYFKAIEPALCSLIRYVPGCKLHLEAPTECESQSKFMTTCVKNGDTTRYSTWVRKLQSLDTMYKLLEIMEAIGSPYLISSKAIVEEFLLRTQEEYNSLSQLLLTDTSEISVLRQLTKLKTSHTETLQLRLASHFVEHAPELSILYIDDCIQKYPENPSFHSLRASLKSTLNDHLGAVEDSNVAIVLNPHDPETMYERARKMHIAMTSTSSVFSPPQVLDAYELYLSYAQVENGKKSKAHYGISQIKLHILLADTQKGTKSMNRMMWKEKLEVVKRIYKISTDLGSQVELLETTMKSEFERFITKVENDYDHSYSNQILKDPKRVALIRDHRQSLKRLKESSSGYNSRLPAAYRPQYHSIPSLKELLPISFRDMILTGFCLYSKRFLAVTILDEIAFDPDTSGPFRVIVEDTNGDVAICFFTNDYVGTQKGYFIGQKLVIAHPMMENRNGVRSLLTWNPCTVVMAAGFVENMCRFCGMPNANFKCSRCKTAKYCSRQCQKIDWKKLKHRLICKETMQPICALGKR